MMEGQRPKNKESFIAASALMQTLFNLKTLPQQATTIHVDLLKDWEGNTNLDELKPEANDS